MDLQDYELQPEKLFFLIQQMKKKNLINDEQRIKAKAINSKSKLEYFQTIYFYQTQNVELVVLDDPSLYACLRNYENTHKNLQILQDQFIYIISLNLNEQWSQSEDKKSNKKVKIVDSSDCQDHQDHQDHCPSRNSSSSSPMSRAGWIKPSFSISKQRLGAKVTKVFTEENISDLNTTKESSPEKIQKVSRTANHTPKSGLQRNQIVIPQLFIDEEDSSPLGKYLFEHKVVHQNVKPSKPRIRPNLFHINDDEFSSPQDTFLKQKKQRSNHH